MTARQEFSAAANYIASLWSFGARCTRCLAVWRHMELLLLSVMLDISN